MGFIADPHSNKFWKWSIWRLFFANQAHSDPIPESKMDEMCCFVLIINIKKLKRLVSLLVELGCKPLLENIISNDNFKHFILSADVFMQFPNKGIRNLPPEKGSYSIENTHTELLITNRSIRYPEIFLRGFSEWIGSKKFWSFLESFSKISKYMHI